MLSTMDNVLKATSSVIKMYTFVGDLSTQEACAPRKMQYVLSAKEEDTLKMFVNRKYLKILMLGFRILPCVLFTKPLIA